MVNLSWKTLKQIGSTQLSVPLESQYHLPEKILQFGTGVLLRGLPDYYVDQANRNQVFQGRIVAVKSTSVGPSQSFDDQDGLYSLTLRGLRDGKKLDQTSIISSVSRILAATSQWDEVLACAANPDISIIISNTTEAGIQLVKEDIHQTPPGSFPAKLLACLYHRFQILGNTPQSNLIIIPTELIPDNGKVLQNFIEQLVAHNNLGSAFLNWLNEKVSFCSSLVDRIVPGRPDEEIKSQLESTFGYHDDLWITAEPYNLWAIEGDGKIASRLSFATSNQGMMVTPDITYYREIKLRLLNGPHTLCCGAAFLAGIDTVYEAATHPVFSQFMHRLMLDEIAPAIPYPIQKKEAEDFANRTFERFCNPFIRHLWLNITTGYTGKMKMRVIPVLLKYYERYDRVPAAIAYGFSAYLLFMKATQTHNNQFFGESNSQAYPIKDDHADDFFALWKKYGSAPDKLVESVLSNNGLWGVDLTTLSGFSSAVKGNLKAIMAGGILHQLPAMEDPKSREAS